MRPGIKLFFFIVVLFNLLYNATLPLHPDEAYYWAWSRNPELSYYDHPPMVAYAIRLITLLGNSESVIRLAAVGAMTGTAWLIYRLGSLLFNQATGEAALVIYLLVPLTHVGFLAITPDPLVSFFWALTLYLVCLNLFGKRKGYLGLAGISVGCTLLSKYTGILLPASLLLFLLFTPRFRDRFASKEMVLAVGLALLVFSPVIAWNVFFDWISFSYQFDHGVADEKVLNLASFSEFFFGQAAVSNPFFFFPLLYLLMKAPLKAFREPRQAILVWPFVFTLLFFGYNALFKKSELNWAMPAMISGSVLLAHWLTRAGRRKVIQWGGVFTLLAIVLFKGPELVPFMPGELVMKNKFYGHDELFAASGIRHSDEFVLSDHYEHAAAISYYLPGQPETYILDGRVSQYTFWRERLRGYIGKDAVWIGQGEPSSAVYEAFERVEYAQNLVYANRFVTKQFNVFRCRNYNGLVP